MAETVKKSRIVSEDDLEESLMQEFNLRLKNCMSQEDEKETEEEEEEKEHIYDNVKLQANRKPQIVKSLPEVVYDEVAPLTSKEFLEIEKQFYDENAPKILDVNGFQTKPQILENVKIEPVVQTTDLDANVELLLEKTDFEHDDHVYETIEDEVIYENVQNLHKPKLTLPTTCLTDMSDDVELETQEAKSVKDRMFLSTDDTSCLLFTQTVTSPMLTPSEENIDFLKGFRRQSSQNTISDNTNSNGSPKFDDTDQPTDEMTESGKNEYENLDQNPTYDDVSETDNALVCNIVIDDTHCDVAKDGEPMEGHVYEDSALQDDAIVEPSHAPILKQYVLDLGSLDLKKETQSFLEMEIYDLERDKFSQSKVSVRNDEDNIYENVENANVSNNHQDVEPETFEIVDSEASAHIDKVESPELVIDPKEITCFLEHERLVSSDDNCVYESNIEQCNGDVSSFSEHSEPHSLPKVEETDQRPDAEEIKDNQTAEELFLDSNVLSTAVQKEAEHTKMNGQHEKPGKTRPDTGLDFEDDDDRLDNPSQLVNALKTKYLHNATAEIVKTPSVEKFEIAQLKTLDIMKQISKFENKSPTNEDANEYSPDSTETSETTYVETTTVESKASVEDKSLKKKKSKKSRSHEKENISVNNTDTNNETNSQEENFYNVNVKNLCRSFGDLTKIGDERYHNEKNTRDRTKSLSDVLSVETNKDPENVFHGVSVKALKEIFSVAVSKTNTDAVVKLKPSEKIERLKSSFNKFDALQKKNVLHVRSSDSSKAQEKFNGTTTVIDSTNCKACGKVVFQMEQMKAEKSIWHKNCFRCQECSKQLTVDAYESNEGILYCKPHFKALFAPKVIEDDIPPKPKKHEMIIRENQPMELPPDVVRASDKPDLGLEELHSLNVRERFQVFEHHEDTNATSNLDRTQSGVNVKRSPSILSKLARFQAKGMDVGVTDDSLNGIPIEETSSEEEQEEEIEGEDADLVRAQRAQKEKPFHFVQMSDVKSKWEHGEQNTKDERREERKQEIQSIRNRLFMGKQGKMKEAYQQAVMESEINVKKADSEPVEACDTRTLKEKFEKGEVYSEDKDKKETEDMSVFESGISKKSRSIFLELDAHASKAPQLSPVSPPKGSDVRKTREVFLARQPSDDVVKSSEQVDDVKIETADIQQRFKFFEAYKEPEKTRRAFRITPPREGQVKSETPDREVYRDPDIVRSEEQVEDSVIAKETHTATKVLNKFRQMEENLNKEPLPLGPKPLKRFTPPPEPTRPESASDEGSESEESEECEPVGPYQDADLLEAQKAARARQLRAKFERWEANEIKREQQSVNIVEEIGEEQSQIESTRALRARFESLKDTNNDVSRAPRVKVNRFVDTTSSLEICHCCKGKVYPLEKISVHDHCYHKSCFKCMECNTVLRMDSYAYNQGLLYCVPHFKRLFISKGNYDTAFGLEQCKEKWNAAVA